MALSSRVLCLRLQHHLLLVILTIFLLCPAACELTRLHCTLNNNKENRGKLQRKEKFLLALRSRRGKKQIHFRVKLEKLVQSWIGRSELPPGGATWPSGSKSEAKLLAYQSERKSKKKNKFVVIVFRLRFVFNVFFFAGFKFSQLNFNLSKQRPRTKKKMVRTGENIWGN